MKLSETLSNRSLPVGQLSLPWAATAWAWLGDCALELPERFSHNLPATLGLIASHRHRTESLSRHWELALEAALQYAKHAKLLPFFSGVSPYAHRLVHACKRFHVDFLELQQVTDSESPRDPLHSARVLHIGNPLPVRSIVPQASFEDRAIAILSNQLFAIHVRNQGKVTQLVEARLAEPSVTPGSTIVACNVDVSGTKRSTAELSLSSSGAVLWLTNPSIREESLTHSKPVSRWGCRNRWAPATSMPIARISAALLESKRYLIHCTRSRHGAWPDQSPEQLFDEAIQMEWHDESTALDTLLRIMISQKLVASSRLRRGEVATVCFTARSLAETLSCRTFQSHLGRWDWEPFGLAIRKEWLSGQGARPVQYLLPKEIDRLSDLEQAFSQPLPVRPNQSDWSVEQEWRALGDIRLCHVPADQAFVFVRSEQDAISLAPWSRWPIFHLTTGH